MFSTAMRTSVRSCNSATDSVKLAAAERCQTNGGWTTTVVADAPDGYVAGDGAHFTGFSPQLYFDAQGRANIVFSDEAGQHNPVSFANEVSGQIMAMFVLTVAAAEAAVGLAILVTFFRNRGDIAVDDASVMKG